MSDGAEAGSEELRALLVTHNVCGVFDNIDTRLARWLDFLTNLDDAALDATGRGLHVFWPSNASTGEKFPLVPYLHGYLGGGLDILAYYDLFHDISSYGFVVAAPAGCSTTCDDRIGLPYTSCGGLPAGPDPYTGSGRTHRWSSYYAEALKTIDEEGDRLLERVGAQQQPAGHRLARLVTSVLATAHGAFAQSCIQPCLRPDVRPLLGIERTLLLSVT